MSWAAIEIVEGQTRIKYINPDISERSLSSTKSLIFYILHRQNSIMNYICMYIYVFNDFIYETIRKNRFDFISRYGVDRINGRNYSTHRLDIDESDIYLQEDFQV